MGTTKNKQAIMAIVKVGSENGATFTPSVSEDGVLSWTNDKGLDNPESVNIKGADGKDGYNGFSPTVIVTKSGKETEIYINDANGSQSATILDGADGKDGTNGKDYVLTEADKDDIASRTAILLRENGVIGVVDENNNIIVSGNLADGTYTLKYENEDGTYTEVGTLEIGAVPEPETVINIISTSIDTDLQTVYNGKGWKEGKRWSASGNKETSGTNCLLTGLIPIGDNGDIFRSKDVSFEYDGTNSGGQIAFWDESGTALTTSFQAITNYATLSIDENGHPAFTFNMSSIPSSAYYFRIVLSPLVENPILTRNQPITE